MFLFRNIKISNPSADANIKLETKTNMRTSLRAAQLQNTTKRSARDAQTFKIIMLQWQGHAAKLIINKNVHGATALTLINIKKQHNSARCITEKYRKTCSRGAMTLNKLTIRHAQSTTTLAIFKNLKD